MEVNGAGSQAQRQRTRILGKQDQRYENKQWKNRVIDQEGYIKAELETF